MINRISKVFVMLFILVLLSGCWNYRELNELNLLAGAAIDRNKENNNYILTAEVINPKGGKETKIVPTVVYTEGITIFDAVRNMIKKIGRKLYWSHAKVFIISEDIAREGIVDVLDFINRDAEIRSEIYLVISKEKTAEELLRGKDSIHDTISFHIQDIMRSQKSIPKYPVAELWTFLKELSAESVSSIIPTAAMTHDVDNITPEMTGTAVFKRDKMVGWLDGDESRSLLFLKGEMKAGLVDAIKVGKDTQATIEISRTSTKTTPIMKDGRVAMEISVKIDAGIAEVIGKEDVISKDGRMKLVMAAQETIKKQMEDTLKKVQEEYKADVVGFGGVVQRAMPDYWKEIKSDWENIFVNMDTNINVDVEITHSALTSKPIKVGR